MSNDFSIVICKVLGPVIVFIGSPLMIFVLYGLTQKELDAGTPLNAIMQMKGFAFMVTFIIFISWFGVYACQKSLGWFGGKNGILSMRRFDLTTEQSFVLSNDELVPQYVFAQSTVIHLVAFAGIIWAIVEKLDGKEQATQLFLKVVSFFK